MVPRSGWMVACVAATVFVSGCVEVAAPPAGRETSTPAPAPSTGPTGSCQPADLQPGRTVRPLAPFVGEDAAVRSRVAQALQEPNIANVTLVRTSGTHLVLVKYEADRVWPGLDAASTRSEIRRYLGALGLDSQMPFNESFHPAQGGYPEFKPLWSQRFRDGEVLVISGETHRIDNSLMKSNKTYMYVGPLYDLRDARVTVNVSRAVEVAVGDLSCASPDRAQSYRPPARNAHLVVHGDSLVWSVELLFARQGHHCGGDTFTVWIDAETEWVHRTHAHPCV